MDQVVMVICSSFVEPKYRESSVLSINQTPLDATVPGISARVYEPNQRNPTLLKNTLQYSVQKEANDTRPVGGRRDETPQHQTPLVIKRSCGSRVSLLFSGVGFGIETVNRRTDSLQ